MAPVSAVSKPKDLSARSGHYTIAVAMVAGLGGLMFGYDIGVIADAKAGIKTALGLGEFEVELVVSSVLAGSFFGALLAGRLCDRIGRRWTNVWGGVLFVIGCIGCCLAQDIGVMVASRVVMGTGVGFSSVAGPLYIAEIAAPWSRGAMVSLYQLAITIGIFLAFLVGLYLTPRDLWRVSFATGSIFGAGLIFGMLAMPPSPRWLVGRGRSTLALGVLKRTMGSTSAAEGELKAIEQRVDRESGDTLLEALRSNPAVKLALILAIGLAFLQQASGINAIFYYAPEILTDIGLGESKLTLTASLGLINVLATFIAIWLVDRIGRRPLLIAGTALMFVSQVVIGLAAFWLPAGGTSTASGGEGGSDCRGHHPDCDLRGGHRLRVQPRAAGLAGHLRDLPGRGPQCLRRDRHLGQLGRQLPHRPRLLLRPEAPRHDDGVLDLRRLQRLHDLLRPVAHARDQGNRTGADRGVLHRQEEEGSWVTQHGHLIRGLLRRG